MSKPQKFLILLVSCCLMFSCTTKMVPGQTPPGQAKKVTGNQSAKPYAPGQQKQ